jgi:hypothetical protein
MPTKKQITVTGDITIDQYIFKGNNPTPDTRDKLGTCLIKSGGGAFQLFKLIKHFEKKEAEIHFGFNADVFDDVTKFPPNQISYAVWEKFKYAVKTAEVENAWKVNQSLGFGAYVQLETGKENVNYLIEHLNPEQTNSNIIVIDDSASEFRNIEDLWKPLFEGSIDQDFIVLKTASPIAKGKLFFKLTKEYQDKLVIITSIDEIREEEVMISKGISWEQTALDLMHELIHNGNINRLLNCRHLIVTLQTEGALCLEIKKGKIYKSRLVFDPAVQEGEWDESVGLQGHVIGLMNCFTAGVISELIEKTPNFDAAIVKGLSAQRTFKVVGYGNDDANMAMPVDQLFDDKVKGNFATAVVPIPENTAGSKKEGFDYVNSNWTILEGDYQLLEPNIPLFDLGLRLALLGENEVQNSPFLKIEALTTYDRVEIEAFRNLKNLIRDYKRNDKGKTPLSLAVFGAPGSGKSFAVKQLAKAQKVPFREFNLSQFEDVEEITSAFHIVRDEVLKGGCPMVFWDEFDSQNFRWLQYLLAPMQDGTFQEGRITHPIGKCIFVFAGGTSYNFQTFGPNLPHYPEKKLENFEQLEKEYEINLEKYHDFKLKKGPDFKSRLSGYLNVKGPNQLEELDEDGNIKLDKAGKSIKDKNDIFFPIRRALFIRNIFGVKEKEKLKADYGLINALILTEKFTHGSRSLEKILSHLKMKDRNAIKRSNLPAFNVLSMMVDYTAFKKHMEEVDEYKMTAYTIAPEIHNNWKRLGDTQGWKLEYHKEYHFLPSHLKDENIAAALRIRELLESEGYEIVPENKAEFFDSVNFDTLVENPETLEKLAIEEHTGWLRFREQNNWKYAEERNDDKRLHNCMVEWEQLTEKDKDKDRDAIKNYQAVLKNAGFVIVKAE